MIKNKNKGFILIEMIIYVALFSIMIGGLFVTVFQLMGSGRNTESKVTVQEEMNFVLRKMDWALEDATDIDVSPDQKTLTITNPNIPGSPVDIEFDAVNKKIKFDTADLTTLNIKVEELSFVYIPKVGTSPAGVSVNLNIDGAEASFSKYLRK